VIVVDVAGLRPAGRRADIDEAWGAVLIDGARGTTGPSR